jgi:hypothetical protein
LIQPSSIVLVGRTSAGVLPGGNGAPSPARQLAAAEGLQPGGVGAEAELSVAERDLPAHLIPFDVVTSDQRVAIDRARDRPR